MYKIKIENMDLQQIADSGQCFRWKRIEEGRYGVVAYDRYLEISQDGEEFEFSCDESEWENIWKSYFDIETDYPEIGKMIMESGDEHLIEAYRSGMGVRILRQDLWEMIVTFMISQNNNIKRITNSVELLCVRAGKGVDGCDGQYRFPRPGEVAEDIFADKTMGFGYRADYLKELYQFALDNPDWIESLKKMTYDEAMDHLMERKGIGKKVANCICLFGLHHVDAFPIDTHVRQLLDKYYSDGFDFEKYKGVAGIIQQYLFYYELVN